MRKTLIALTALLGAVIGLTQPYWAGAAGTPASKATAQVGDVKILTSEDMGWTQILNATLKTSNNKDLFADVSLECGLFTGTKVASEAGVPDTSTAEAAVDVVVVLDQGKAGERTFLPGDVTFCRRVQTLMGKYAGIENCEDKNDDGDTEDEGECDLTPEETELLLETMDANAFNFILADVAAGVHTITVLAKIDLDEKTTEDTQGGTAEAKAAIGNGSVTIESVRMVKNNNIELG